MNEGGDSSFSRREVLKASSGAVGIPLAGGRPGGARADCPDATIEPSMRHYEGGGMDCDDDHPATERLQADVEATLEDRYPDVGALIGDGFVPYFDVKVSPSQDGYSHWINPAHLADETVLDPDRPESVLVDNRWWRPIGVMFIATKGGEPVEDPPPVYGGGKGEGKDKDKEPCSPWHYHVGLPGRFAWWVYRQAYETEYRTGDVSFPCATPHMLHVWTVPHPESTYAHGPPPQENRGGPPAEDPGFETSAKPGEDELDWDALPGDLRARARPDDAAARVRRRR